jgi:eukaryotic-like serine/threonine-protein kinase
MPDEARVEALLEELLDSDCSPEEVCRDSPELLSQVRAGWQRIRALQSEVDELFPDSDPAADQPARKAAVDPPRVPGYDVGEVLGRGGVGVVYKAWHQRLHRPVALKMLLAGPHARPQELERFLREAEAVAGLRHPNVVQVHNAGEVDGRPFFTMELVEGGSLAQKVAGVPQPARDAAALVAMVADGIHAAHQSGIVHRDVKPGNVLLTADGAPKISDFGLARRFQESSGLTLTGAPMGTPSYMAPEQARGEKGALAPAADVYALGAILYELLTGRPPFHGATAAATLHQVLEDEPVPPARLNPGVPRDLQTIRLKCLHKESDRRYASAAALAEDLRRYVEGRPIRARPVGWAERSWRWGRRNPTGAALLATALALVGLAIGGGMWAAQQRGERRAEVAQRDRELRNEVGTAVAQAARLRKGFHFREARELLEQARQRLAPAGPQELRRQVDQGRSDLNLAERLDAVRIEAAALVGGARGVAGAEPPYVSAFAEAGLGREGDDSEAVSARVRDSALSAELIAALDDWASITIDQRRREWLLKVARMADNNPARNRLRQPGLWRDGVRLAQIAQEPSGADVSPQLALALDRAAHESGGDAIPLLIAVQARYPQDFWINLGLGSTLSQVQRWDEALGYWRAALAIRPDVSVACNSLGVALWFKDRRDEAIVHFKEAVRLDPNAIAAHINLGTALCKGGRLEEGMDQYQQALRLEPKLAAALFGLSANISDAIHTALWAAAGQESVNGRLDESERTRLRLQVLGWLRVYLEFVTKLRETGARAGWSPASWELDSALASVRDPAELAKLPATEREQWQRLWADVAVQAAADPLGQGRARAARREWAQAADGYTRALKLDPTYEGHVWFEYAAVLLLSGDRPGYARACAQMAERCGKPGGPRAYHVARACTLGPDVVADAALPGRLAEKELHNNARQFWSLTEQGALAYRAGRFHESVPLFEESLRADAKPGRAVLNSLWLALANHRLGKSEEARRWLDKAQVWLDQFGDGMPDIVDQQLGLDLHNWLEAHVLRREAEALLQSKGPRSGMDNKQRGAPPN